MRLTNSGFDKHYFKKAWYLYALKRESEDYLIENVQKYAKYYDFDFIYMKKVIDKCLPTTDENAMHALNSKLLSLHIDTCLKTNQCLFHQNFSRGEILGKLTLLLSREELETYADTRLSEILKLAIKFLRKKNK